MSPAFSDTVNLSYSLCLVMVHSNSRWLKLHIRKFYNGLYKISKYQIVFVYGYLPLWVIGYQQNLCQVYKSEQNLTPLFRSPPWMSTSFPQNNYLYWYFHTASQIFCSCKSIFSFLKIGIHEFPDTLLQLTLKVFWVSRKGYIPCVTILYQISVKFFVFFFLK